MHNDLVCDLKRLEMKYIEEIKECAGRVTIIKSYIDTPDIGLSQKTLLPVLENTIKKLNDLNDKLVDLICIIRNNSEV